MCMKQMIFNPKLNTFSFEENHLNGSFTTEYRWMTIREAGNSRSCLLPQRPRSSEADYEPAIAKGTPKDSEAEQMPQRRVRELTRNSLN